MSINSTSAYWSMMQKVDQGDYEVVFNDVVFRKKEDTLPHWTSNVCGNCSFNWGTSDTSNCYATPFWYYWKDNERYCVNCHKKVDAMYCYKCMVGGPIEH